MLLEWLTEVRWSPYVVGAGIGVLSWFTLLVSGKPLGSSTTFTRMAGMMERLVRGRRVLEKAYYREFAPTVDWQFMLVIGIVIGAFVSARLSGSFQPRLVPETWLAGFGPGGALRVGAAFAGGVLLGFGARWADGCTSGHGISGAMQLAVSSWISAICFFIGGVVTAYLLFGRLW